MVFSEVVGTLSFLVPQSDDDFADRANYYITSTALLVTAVLVSLKLFGGRPLDLKLNLEPFSWEDYTEMYCFASSTYFVQPNQEFPDADQRDQRLISYYQWMPFYLVISAFSFYAPCMIWFVIVSIQEFKTIPFRHTKSGIQLKELVSFANDKSNIKPEKRDDNIAGMGEHLSSVFKHRYSFGTAHPIHQHRYLRILNLRFYESYLTFLYLGIKGLYLLNVVFQMFMMNYFLKTKNYTVYGFGVLIDLVYGRPWTESGNFPRVSFCDLDIRQVIILTKLVLGNIQRHTIQCVLVINIFIEKIFVLLWIWYTVLFIVTLTSLINWSLSSLPFEARKRFISRRLELADVEFKQHLVEENLNRFVSEYIKMDGVFVLKMLTIHSVMFLPEAYYHSILFLLLSQDVLGVLICTELVDRMWDKFQEEQSKQNADNNEVFPVVPRDISRRKTSVLVPLVARAEQRPFFQAASPVTPITPYFGSPPTESILRMPTQQSSFGPTTSGAPLK
ncbi:Innexin [Aphelenchoides besseyi]|nr:Innexin [Aphelenchoides besseyi]